MDRSSLSVDSGRSSKGEVLDDGNETSKLDDSLRDKYSNVGDDSVEIKDLTIQQSKSLNSGDDEIWAQRTSRYTSKMEIIKQLELNRNKFAFIIYRPIPSIVICISIGLLILSIAATMMGFSRNIDNIVVSYDEKDKDPIKFEVKYTLYSPVYVYHRISRFYISHKKIANDSVHKVYTKNACLGVNKLRELLDLRCIDGKNTLYSGDNGDKLCQLSKNNLEILDREIYPCGISSATIMTDEYDICSDSSGSKCFDITMPVDSRESDIFKSLFEYGDDKLVWIDPMNIRLRRWNVIPFGSNFQVLYGIIEQDVSPGTYYLRIRNNTWPSKEWNARKYMSIMTTTVFGDKGSMFIMVIVGIGLVYLLTGILFLVTYCLSCNAKRNDLEQFIKGKKPPPLKECDINDISKDGFDTYVDPKEKTLPCLCPLH